MTAVRVGLRCDAGATRGVGHLVRCVALAEELARRAALAIDNARLYGQAQQELEERRRVESELRRSEERFRAMMEQSPLSTQLLGRDGVAGREQGGRHRDRSAGAGDHHHAVLVDELLGPAKRLRDPVAESAAAAAAMAASTALPPWRRTASPACAASGCEVATTLRANTGVRTVG